LYSSVLLVPIRSELTAHGSRYKAAERTWTHSKHISRDRYSASLLARRVDLQKTQLPLLLRVGPCLQSCCLETRYSNPLQYYSENYQETENYNPDSLERCVGAC
jgi:hypothetical protein